MITKRAARSTSQWSESTSYGQRGNKQMVKLLAALSANRKLHGCDTETSNLHQQLQEVYYQRQEHRIGQV